MIVVLVLLTALVASGTGAAAWLKLGRDHRPHVVARMWLAETPYYRITHPGKSRYRLEPTEALAAYPRGAAAGVSTQPEVRIDVTNTRDRTISVNEVELAFRELETEAGGARTGAPPVVRGPRIVITFREGHDTHAAHAALAADFGLVVDRVQGNAVHCTPVRPAPPAALEELVRSIADHPSVAAATLDVTGEPHSAFDRLEVVQLRLRHGTRTYRHPVGHTVAARESLTIPLAVGCDAPLTGSAVVRLLLDGEHTRDVGELEVRLAPPARVAVLQEGDDQEGDDQASDDRAGDDGSPPARGAPAGR
ncbi:hypothetical protein [Streptomyces sp. NPDC059063]|uniref:hypothetical protein n=1 Tax=unclassified Streptomyces TaxID=2593676 RepID=UPI0036CE4AAB